jgi:L-amino acid N-acyltransferase YncA
MGRRIRLADTADATEVREIYAPFVESTAVAFETTVPSVPETADRIESRLEEYPWLVCVSGGTVVGYAAADGFRATPPYRWSVELSVYVAEEVRRSGVGSALYAALLAVLDEQGYCSAYAVVTLPNPASERLHDGMGFEPVGTFPAVGYKRGEWHDVQWWYRPVGERPPDPDPPTPLRALDEHRIADALHAGQRRLDG